MGEGRRKWGKEMEVEMEKGGRRLDVVRKMRLEEIFCALGFNCGTLGVSVMGDETIGMCPGDCSGGVGGGEENWVSFTFVFLENIGLVRFLTDLFIPCLGTMNAVYLILIVFMIISSFKAPSIEEALSACCCPGFCHCLPSPPDLPNQSLSLLNLVSIHA